MLQGEHLFQAPDGRTPRMDAHAKGSQVPQRGGGALCPASHFQRPPTRPFPAPFRLEEKEGHRGSCYEGRGARRDWLTGRISHTHHLGSNSGC